MWPQGQRLTRRREPASPEPDGNTAEPLATWVLAAILALLLTVLSVAFVLTVWGPSGWDTASFAVGAVTLLSTLLFSLNAFRDYRPGQFALATAAALLVAAAAGFAVYLVLEAGPEGVREETTLSGGAGMGVGDEAKVTVAARPTGGELRLRFEVTNDSPGTSCLSLSDLAVSGASLTEPLAAELDEITEVTVPVDESAPGTTVTLALQGADGEPAQSGCRVSLDLLRAEYN